MSFWVSIVAVFQRRPIDVEPCHEGDPPYAGRVAGPTPTTLDELLDDELAFDATTGTRLSSHLPMALVALDRLGADGARLTEFARRYRTRLVPVPDAEPVASFDGVAGGPRRAARLRTGPRLPRGSHRRATVATPWCAATPRRSSTGSRVPPSTGSSGSPTRSRARATHAWRRGSRT